MFPLCVCLYHVKAFQLFFRSPGISSISLEKLCPWHQHAVCTVAKCHPSTLLLALFLHMILAFAKLICQMWGIHAEILATVSSRCWNNKYFHHRRSEICNFEMQLLFNWGDCFQCYDWECQLRDGSCYIKFYQLSYSANFVLKEIK